jgi:hypothetical protein
MNVREQEKANVLCVFFMSPSPHIYRCVQGCYGRENIRSHREPTLRSNGEAPHAGGKTVAPKLVQPNKYNSLWPPPLAGTLVGGPSGLWSMSWRCPNSVICSSGPSDSWEAERRVLIGQRGVALD